MAKANHARVPQGATCTSPDRRRRHAGRQSWVWSCHRVHCALDASVRLIDATLRTVARSESCADRRPMRAARTLDEASAMLRDASMQLREAARGLELTKERYRREPSFVELAPEFLAWATERWQEVAASLEEAADEVFWLREYVLLGLETGLLTPEPPAERRPRIVLAPRPAPVRAFLRLRQPRVADRIAPILRRRRRTPRPASVRVPRRSLLGRAPPLLPILL